MSKNYFAPHEIVAKIFRAPSKIVKNFSYPTYIRSPRAPGIRNGRSLRYMPHKIISYEDILKTKRYPDEISKAALKCGPLDMLKVCQ